METLTVIAYNQPVSRAFIEQVRGVDSSSSVSGLLEKGLIGLDIKEKLQNIADGKPFNVNYNYVVDKYFNNNPNTLVIVNNNKYNDFYSYCQGLHHIGRKETIIQNVIVETEDE